MKHNTFSEKSVNYAEARPHYPNDLYVWIAEQCTRREAAWDCATGNGQAAIGLSRHFKQVTATDISQEQIDHSMLRDNIDYQVRSAEESGLEDDSVDLITVAQALHWFDYDRFWPEVQRVARPGALFCAWGYAWLNSLPVIDEGLIIPFRKAIEPFWAPNNKILWDGYRIDQIRFPFAPIVTPGFEISLQWSVRQLVDYMKTWSAYKLSRKNAEAASTLDKITADAITLAPDKETIPVRMPLIVIAGFIKS